MNVLIVGSGPSGIDITFDLCKVAKHVGISHHSTTLDADLFPTNVVQFPDIDRISVDGDVYFSNDLVGFYDAIIFCTGYKYKLSFLTDTCGIRTINNHVTSLYKHVLNIERPTMFFIGLTNVTIFTHLIELQVCLKRNRVCELIMKCSSIQLSGTVLPQSGIEANKLTLKEGNVRRIASRYHGQTFQELQRAENASAMA